MKINSKSLKKLNNYAKIFKVLWYLGFLLGIFIIVTIVLYQAGIMTENLGLKLEYMGISIKIDNSYLDNAIFLPLQLSLLISWCLFMYILYKIKGIIETTLKEGTPFIKENIDSLKQISYSFFISAGLFIILEILMGLSLISNKLLEEVNKLQGIEMTQSISLPEWPIIIGILILVLAEIFQHGYQLQQDSESIV